MKLIILIFYMLIVASFSCRTDTMTNAQLELVADFHIDVSEPSGLAINKSGNILYTVSDHTNKVYKLSLTGKVLQSYAFIGNDLEGVTTYTDGKLLLADERIKTIIVLDLSNGKTAKYPMIYNNEENNAGIEGICYDPTTQIIYFLNEKKPGKLFKLNKSFKIISSKELDFANDYSGMFYDTSDKTIWIVSDESQSIFQCDQNGKLIKSYIINVNKPEGIAIYNDNIYIISDSENKLYVFKKPN